MRMAGTLLAMLCQISMCRPTRRAERYAPPSSSANSVPGCLRCRAENKEALFYSQLPPHLWLLVQQELQNHSLADSVFGVLLQGAHDLLMVSCALAAFESKLY